MNYIKTFVITVFDNIIILIAIILLFNSSLTAQKKDFSSKEIAIKNDSLISVLNSKLKGLENEVVELNNWYINQKAISSLTDKRISDNLAYSDKILSITSSGVSIFAFIITVMNVILFVWIFAVQRNLKKDTEKLNEESRESRIELNEKTEEFYKEMLNSKFGRYDTRIRDQIANEDKNEKFEKITDFRKRVIRAEKELVENNIRDAIRHFEELLKEGKDTIYIKNRIGICYWKLGAYIKSMEFFEEVCNSDKKNRSKFCLNLLGAYIINDKKDDANKLIKECESYAIDDDYPANLFTLKFIFFSKYNMKQELNELKKKQEDIQWNVETKWDFYDFSSFFKKEYTNDFYQIYRYSNIINKL